MASAEKVPMLAEGHRKLNDELKRLKSERPEIVEAIEEARAHGDLSENAEYHAAKERQGQIEATIADLEDRLSRAMVIDPTTLSGDKVVFGATVTLIDEDEKKVKYQLVGQTEADAKVGPDQLQFAARPGADRPPGGRGGRGLDPVGRPLLRDQEDRVHLIRWWIAFPRTATIAITRADRAGVGRRRGARRSTSRRPSRSASFRRGFSGVVGAVAGGAGVPDAADRDAGPSGLIHLGFNLLIFVWCGTAVERVLGQTGLVIALRRRRLCRGARAMGGRLRRATVPMIGASGAISAVIGAFALSFGRAQAVHPHRRGSTAGSTPCGCWSPGSCCR